MFGVNPFVKKTKQKKKKTVIHRLLDSENHKI